MLRARQTFLSIAISIAVCLSQAAPVFSLTARAPAPVPAATTYVMTELGGVSTIPSDINNSGQVAGTTFTDDFNFRAFRWSAGGPVQLLGVLGSHGASHSFATGINNAGQVVGYSTTGDSSLNQAFIWSDAVGMEQIDLAALGNETNASDINDAGQVVGTATTRNEFGGLEQTRAFLYNPAGGAKSLGSNDTSANAINHSGQVAGSTTDEDGTVRAFRYDGVMHNLGTLGTFDSEFPGTSTGSSINGAGQVVGMSSTSSGAGHAFLHTPGVGMMSLGALGSEDNSQALDINNRGEVVGGSAAGESFGRAFIWDAANGI